MTAQAVAARGVLPYARPYWDAAEAAALLDALESGTWTNGPFVVQFEQELERLAGAPAVVLSSGTAAIHALLHVLGRRIRGPKLLLTPALNFAAAPAVARLLGWDVALCDVSADDLTIDPASAAEVLERTRSRYAATVVLPVHYAGHTANMTALAKVCADVGASIVEDACHAAGARYADSGIPVGGLPDSLAAYFSFHPVKPVAAGEGGAVVTSSRDLATELRMFRNHNMAPVSEHEHDGAPWPYVIEQPGMNLRLSELHAAIGVAQARRAEESRLERARLAARYHEALAGLPAIRAIPGRPREGSAHHLFPVVFDLGQIAMSKRELVGSLHGRGIGCQVHYTPLHRLPAFADVGNVLRTSLRTIDAVFPGLLSLPLWRGMTDGDQDRVIDAVSEIVHGME